MFLNERIRRIVKAPLLILFYITILQLLSMTVGSSMLLPTPGETVKALVSILADINSWQNIGATFLRLIIGFGIGSIMGIALAAITASNRFFYTILSPLRLIIKSTPVLSFVLILLVSLYSNIVPIAVCAIMVTPMLWATTETAILSIDPKLTEMGKIYYKPFKRLFLVDVPQMFPQIATSAVTALGFAWKAVITAEVLSLPRFAVGNKMYLSKLYLETPDMFAWTLLVIALSLCLEMALRMLTSRLEK
jgi:NitT/TauT family transport system permease protein